MTRKPAKSRPTDATGPAGLDAGMRAMFDQMLEGVQLIDADYRYLYVNETAARHGHRTREELVGNRMIDLYPGIDKSDFFTRLIACLRDGVPQRMLNEFTYPDGSIGWFDLHLMPVPAGALILSMDVTELKRGEQELRRTVAALEIADRRKSEMLAMLAHELRNPLAPIRNGLAILRAAMNRDETSAKAAEMMERQIRHLTRFVDDLLDANRVVHGKMTLKSERLDLVRIVRAAIDDHSVTFAERGVRVRSELPETPVWVGGDDARLAQIFANLLDNASKFTPSGGDVVVNVASVGDANAVVTVRDSGIGIASEALPLLFDPLFQADTSLDRRRGGLGLGLSVAKGIAELHGGSIVAESAGTGRGTTMRVTLPRQSEPAPLQAVPMKTSAAAEDPRGARRSTRRILVIEDNRDAAKTLGMILGVWGYRVALAHSGPDGVDSARSNKPHIVLCDIGLPGMDGYEVARVLRREEETRSARMIAITGYGQEDDRTRALEAGFDLHLAKPVNPDFLRAQLEVAIPAPS